MTKQAVAMGFVLAMLSATPSRADFLNTGIPPNSDLSGLEVIQWDTPVSGSPTLVTGTGINDGNPAGGQPSVNVLDLTMNGSSSYTFTHNFASGKAQAGGGTEQLDDRWSDCTAGRRRRGLLDGLIGNAV